MKYFCENHIQPLTNFKDTKKSTVSIVDFEYINIKDGQITFTCFKSTIETLEKGVKYVQS